MKEKVKIFLQQNWFKTIIAFVILLIGVSILYYFVFFLSAKEKAGLQQQENKFKACEQNCALLNFESEDYYLCKAECREKYAQPLPDLPKLPSPTNQ